jgi:hypothetical protein
LIKPVRDIEKINEIIIPQKSSLKVNAPVNRGINKHTHIEIKKIINTKTEVPIVF